MIRVLLCVRLLWLIKGVYVRISCFVVHCFVVCILCFCVMYKSANYILVYRLTGDGYLNEQRWC